MAWTAAVVGVGGFICACVGHVSERPREEHMGFFLQSWLGSSDIYIPLLQVSPLET